jgi:hypothetical protein
MNPQTRMSALRGSWAALNPKERERIGTLNLENAEHRTSNIERRMLPLAAAQRQHSMFGVRRSMFDVSCSGSW